MPASSQTGTSGWTVPLVVASNRHDARGMAAGLINPKLPFSGGRFRDSGAELAEQVAEAEVDGKETGDHR